MENKFNMSESRRRSHVGMDVAFWQVGGLGNLDSSFPPVDSVLSRYQFLEMLRRSKMYLSMREPDAELISRLERRRK